MSAAEDRVEGWLAPFARLFTRPSWRRVVVLVTGALLTPHRRTVSSALKATEHAEAADFARYHAVLNRNRWSALAAAKVLLGLLVARFAVGRPVVIGLDDTIERRWGAKIKARRIYRDPVRSSHSHFHLSHTPPVSLSGGLSWAHGWAAIYGSTTLSSDVQYLPPYNPTIIASSITTAPIVMLNTQLVYQPRNSNFQFAAECRNCT